MGNDIKKVGNKIGHMLYEIDQQQDCTTQGIPINAHQNMEDAKVLNVLLAKNVVNLGSKLEMDPSSLSKNGNKWENSIMRGLISIEVDKDKYEQLQISKLYSSKQKEKSHINQMHQQQQSRPVAVYQQCDFPLTKSYNIILTLTQLYELKRTLASYSQQEQSLQTKRKSADGKLCVICLDAKPEQVLPCAHAYCTKCMDAYVVNKDKKCPMCRKSYRESIKQNIYQIVQWDQEFVQQMRNIYYKILEKNNSREIRKIKKYLRLNEN